MDLFQSIFQYARPVFCSICPVFLHIVKSATQTVSTHVNVQKQSHYTCQSIIRRHPRRADNRYKIYYQINNLDGTPLGFS
jgi:hypothetical protein